MEYVLTPHNNNHLSYTYWEDLFNINELNHLQELSVKDTSAAGVGGSSMGRVDDSIRRSDITWLHNTPEYSWIFAKLGYVISNLNSKFYHYDLTGFGEPIQLTNYRSEDNGMYGWHSDIGVSGPSRKLSLVLQLSDPSEYEGGHLEIMHGPSNVERIRKRQGLITVFPSWLLHQVTPVTAGFRQSLVVWVTGPSFK